MVCSSSENNTNKMVYALVMAAIAIANVVKTSLGPEGLDKMLVDDVGV
jgi:chaperonin GroEL (HSP60 family)